MLAAALALAVHVTVLATLGFRHFRNAAGSDGEMQTIELAEAARRDTASSVPDDADAARRDAAEEPAAAAQPAVATTALAVSPPAPTGDAPTATRRPMPTVAAPRRAVVKPSTVRHTTGETVAHARPTEAKTSGARRREGSHAAGDQAEAAGSTMSVGDWNSLVAAQIRRNRHYPESARSRGEAGVANVLFSVARSGVIGAARLASSSGYPDLDAEAVAAVRRSNPLPPPPGALGTPVARNVPIRFDLR